jgi:hypothetical protein
MLPALAPRKACSLEEEESALSGRPVRRSHLFLQQAEQQVQAIVRPELSACALCAVRHAAEQADRQRAQLRRLLPVPLARRFLRLHIEPRPQPDRLARCSDEALQPFDLGPFCQCQKQMTCP